MKTVAKVVITIAIVATCATAGILRLHEGQIQERQEDGSWKCADAKIRDIVNRDPNESSELFFGTDSVWTYPETEELEITYTIGLDTYDPNRWEIPDSFIKSMCESGRVCEVMGHSWEHHYCLRPDVQERCRLCGAIRTKKERWEIE